MSRLFGASTSRISQVVPLLNFDPPDIDVHDLEQVKVPLHLPAIREAIDTRPMEGAFGRCPNHSFSMLQIHFFF